MLYRFYAGDNSHPRPPYYSKELCLESLLQAAEQCSGASVLLLQDGYDEHPALSGLQGRPASLLREEPAGNSGSFVRALDFALNSDWDEDTIVYFVEDDYLHQGDSLLRLERGAAALPQIDYFTLYEHPNSYAFGVPDAREFVYVDGLNYWRTITSTCMTFAARLSALRRDSALFRAAATGPNPNDYPLWLAIQGGRMPRLLLEHYHSIPRAGALLGSAKAAMLRRRRPESVLLACCLPSGATHLDLSDGLAPMVDWAAVARTVKERGEQ